VVKYRPDGKISSYTEYEHNSDGTIKTETQYRADGSVKESVEYMDDGSIRNVFYNEDGALDWYRVDYYDENRNNIYWVNYDSEGKVKNYHRIEIDDDGKKINIEYGPDGNELKRYIEN
jgi:hypothetical protein